MTTMERRLQAATCRCSELREQLENTKEELVAERKLRRLTEMRVRVLKLTLATHDRFASPRGFIQTHTGEEL